MVDNTLKIIFMGTPQFAVPSLVRLITDTPHAVVGIVTQPDRPSGRGLKFVTSPVKQVGLKYEIPLLQPEKIRSQTTREWLDNAQPDYFIVVAYGKILPKSILTIPRFGSINVHASLLPLYRGAAPINWALISGETETGVTTMLMDEGMDTGDLLLQRKCTITAADTAQTLHDRLSELGAQLLLETLQGLCHRTVTPVPQNHNLASYAPLLNKDSGRINWSQTAQEIDNFIRGVSPWPGAFTFFHSRRIKIIKARVVPASELPLRTPGSVVKIDPKHGLFIATGAGAVMISQLQPEAKKPLSAQEFINGYHCRENDQFQS